MSMTKQVYLEAFLLLVLICICDGSDIGHQNLKVGRSWLKPEPQSFPEAVAANQNKPAVFFEVTKPLDVPKYTSPCSVHLLHHSFANTINSPPFITTYTPTPKCGVEWEMVVLKWKATCKGRQFDRISAIWLSGVEIFRTCTAEPTRDGIEWEVLKDVTRFSVLFKANQSLVVSLGNVVDSTYTGIYNVTLTADFYPLQNQIPLAQPSEHHADLILPISQASPLKGGHWFTLQDKPNVTSVSLTVPTNVYKAVLEICLSFHGNDEFWYTNPTNDYIKDNNLTNILPGNGPLREVVALIDHFVAGAVWPLPVVYTGGINPLFWRPVAAIGAFNLPSYDFDISSFLAVLADGRAHNISLTVTNALSFWLVDANLHLWLDPDCKKVTGSLTEYRAPDFHAEYEDSYAGLDGNISTRARRSISYSGYVMSSYGNITTSSFHSYEFHNLQIYSNDGSTSLVKQSTHTKSRVSSSKLGSDMVDFVKEEQFYPLSLFSNQVPLPNGTIILNYSLSHAFNRHAEFPHSGSIYLLNSQDANGFLTVFNNTIVGAFGALKQNYSYKSDGDCYYRSLSARNYTLLSDIVVTTCLFPDVPNCITSPHIGCM